MISLSDMDKAIGQILSNATDDNIKNVIGSYQQTKTVQENINVLCANFQREPLKDTFAFLKNLSTEYPVQALNLNITSRNKADFARDIVKFIDFLKPTQCLVCSTNYVSTREDHSENLIKCHLCKRPSHTECYHHFADNTNIGIIFLCSECMSVNIANELATNQQAETVDKNTATVQAETGGKNTATVDASSKPAEIQENTDQHNDKEKPEEVNDGTEQNDAQDCPLYLKRICPHGLTGRREVMGKTCPLKHRHLCIYFARQGPQGCRFKKKCKFLHPTVCQNSQKLRVCLNDSCTHFHFKGTQRVATDNTILNKPTTNYNNKPTTFQTTVNKPIQPWSEDIPPIPQEPPNANQTMDFLEKYLREMKNDLQTFTTTMIQRTFQTSLPMLTKSTPEQQQQTQFNQPNLNWFPASQHHTLQQIPSTIPPQLQQSTEIRPHTYNNHLYNQQFPQLPITHQPTSQV